ncbi:MAG: hypothetical protein M1144_07100 [Candidatus Thermoplasmatota archaeon]|nr:hypothetical protein [Candidatus Thermoplasmatota archaeon]
MSAGIVDDPSRSSSAGEEKEQILRRARLIRWISLAFLALFAVLVGYLLDTGSGTFPFWPVLVWLEFVVWCVGILVNLYFVLFVTGGFIARFQDEAGPSQLFLHHMHQMALIGILLGGIVPGFLLFLLWRQVAGAKPPEAAVPGSGFETSPPARGGSCQSLGPDGRPISSDLSLGPVHGSHAVAASAISSPAHGAHAATATSRPATHAPALPVRFWPCPNDHVPASRPACARPSSALSSSERWARGRWCSGPGTPTEGLPELREPRRRPATGMPRLRALARLILPSVPFLI